MKTKPLVSVIVPTYNRPHFLPVVLNSLISQRYTNWEAIVVNDHGVDAKPVIDAMNDNRIKYVEHSVNKGLGAARNTGIQNSKGDYFCFIDDDDGAYSYHISHLLDHAQFAGAKVIYSNAVRIHQEKVEENKYKVIGMDIPYSVDFNRDLLMLQNISPVTPFMVAKDALLSVPPFDETVSVYEDWIMWIELSRKYDFLHIPEPTCFYTWRQDQSSMSSSRNGFTTELPAVYKRFEQYQTPEIVKYQDEILKARGVERIK
jgi:GT2 family glycosyltransferase